MTRILAVVVLALVTGVLAGGCGGSTETRSSDVIAYSNGIDIKLLDLGTGMRTTLVPGRAIGAHAAWDASGVTGLDPVWSPDGTRIAYVRDADKTSIWVVNVATRRRWRISGNLGVYSGYGLRWSPDGRWLAFRDTEAGALWVARSNGRGRRVLYRRASGSDEIGTLGWAPDGRLVLRDGHTRLAARPEGGAARPYAGRFHPRNLGSDDLSRVTVVRDEQGDDQVVVQRPPGRTIGSLTADRSLPGRVPIRSNAPSWSPDGGWVAFNRNGAVVVVDGHGRHERRLLEDGAIGRWSPDGRYLLVRSRLEEKPLWAYDPRSGRRRLVAASIVLRDIIYEHEGASWRPETPARFTPVAPERPLPRRIRTPFPERTFVTGHVHIEAGRHLQLPFRDEISDVSPNGRLLALWIPTGRFTARVAVFDLATGALRDVGIGASPSWSDHGSFDRRGGQVLYRHWNELRTVSLASGHTRVITTRARQGSVRWLRDGGLAYVDHADALVVIRADGTVRRRTRFSAGEAESLAVAPDGDRVLYARGCDVWLADLRTGAIRRFAHASYIPRRDSWSPTGRYVVLSTGWWWRCNGEPGGFGWYDEVAILDLQGRVLERLRGGINDWSGNDRFLLSSGGVTGTEVAGAQPLLLSDLRTRRTSVLLPGASTGPAFVLPGRGLVFGGFDNAGAVHTGGDMQPRLYIGRFTAPR